MKDIYSLSFIIFIIIGFDTMTLSGQIQKIYAPNADSTCFFGGYVGVDEEKILISGDDCPVYYDDGYDSTLLCFYVKENNIWKYSSTEKIRGSGFNQGVFGNYIIRLDNNYLCYVQFLDKKDISDTLFLKKKENGSYITKLKILLAGDSRNSLVGMCMYDDWFMYRISSYGVNDTITFKDYFYRLNSGGWELTDSLNCKSYQNGNIGIPSTQKFHMTDKYLIIGDIGYFYKGVDSDRGQNNGKVDVYAKHDNDKWSHFQLINHLEVFDRGNFFGMGTEISSDNQFLFIGAHYSIDKIPKVYVYKLGVNGFDLFQTLTETEAGLFYGNSLSLEKGVLLVGSYGSNKSGMIFQYEFDGNKWVRKAKIQPQNNTDFDLFGVNIDQMGETVVAGASYDLTYQEYNGAAYIFQIPARDTLRAEICQGQSYTFNDTVIYDEGHYTDTLLASYGVDSVVQLYLTVHPEGRVDIDTVLCEKGDMLQVGDSILTEVGTYEIRLKDIFGCDSIVTVHLDYESLEVVDSITADYGCENGKIDLILQNVNNPPYAFSWSGGETMEDISGLSSGVYSVKITDKSGCEYQYEYTVDDSIAYLIPNAFFPSGQEELNKTFRIYQAKEVNILTTEIYDRWGEKVFNGGQNEYWDGTYQGKMQSPGVYLYRIVMDSPCGEEVKTGQVMLLR